MSRPASCLPDTVPLAPVALFAYARPDHLARTLAALRADPLAAQTDLHVFCDAPRNEAARSGCEAVRGLVQSIDGFASVQVIERDVNFGLARSIIEGVSNMLSQHEQVIVLEDDLKVSPHFLKYMNDALTLYAKDERVISVHGYVYPVYQELPEAFFLRGADCWGWATWRRGWALFNPDGQKLYDELKRRELINSFNFNGAYPFSRMLKDQIKGRNDSWAIRWHASAFLADKLTLHPGRSLVQNIGNDGSGTHCGNSNNRDVELSNSPINLNCIEVIPSLNGCLAFEKFYRASRERFIIRLFNYCRRALILKLKNINQKIFKKGKM